MKINDALKLFTDQEKKVFYLAIEGLKCSEMASILEISEFAIRWHLTKIYAKTNTKSRSDLLSSLVDGNIVVLLFQLKKELDEIKDQVLKNSITPLPKGNSK